MAREYTIAANPSFEILQDLAFKGQIKTVSIDLNAWAEDNNTITSATWVVDAGNVSISGEALASNVISAQITANNSGSNMIKITVVTGTETFVIYYALTVKDPSVVMNSDYGFYR